MNKKLVASLLTLGLVFSPITGAITETYATEAGTDESDENKQADQTKEEKALEKIEKIQTIASFYEMNKNDNDYRLGDDELKNELESTIEDALTYADTGIVSLEDLDSFGTMLETSLTNLSNNGKENQKNLKLNIISSRKLIANNVDKKDSEEYKVLSEKIIQAVEFLRKENLETESFENLKKINNELVDAYLKAIEKFEDKTDYSTISEKDYKEFESEIKNQNEGSNFDKLLKERQALLDKDEAFKITEDFVKASTENKEAYTKAFEELKNLTDLKESEENSKLLSEKLNNVKQAKEKITGKESSPEASVDEQKKQEIQKEKDKLKTYISDIANINKIIAKESFKNKELGEEYNKVILKAMGLAMKEDDSVGLKEYQDTVAKLKDLTDKIKTEDQKPGPITPVEPTEKQFKTYEDAREAIIKLLDDTKGITIEDFYGADQKEARDAYNKARDDAYSILSNKDASLVDLNKAYNAFNKSLRDLNDFLRKRLEKLRDEAKTYIESDNFKKASEENQKTYKDLIAKAKEELEKNPADANVLNKLYKDINAAKEAIDGKLSDQAKKLKAEIKDYDRFKELEAYKSAVSSRRDSKLFAAANKYQELIKKAKELEKAGKLDSEEAKTTLELIENAKAFIEGKISDKRYQSTENYHILKELTKQKGYTEKVNQAARDRIETALKMYDDNKESEDSILSALDAALKDDSVKKFMEEINKDNDPYKNRDAILSKLRTLVEGDKEFRAGDKYKKAPKELRADYDKAFEEAQKIIGMESPTEAEAKDAYEKLIAAVNKLEERYLIDRRLVVLANKFKENQLKIANPNDRKAIADKINALKNNPYTTAEEVEKVEKELDDLINKSKTVTTTTVTPTTQAPTTQVPTTTRPVSTITNPGSSAKTGINGIAKVAAVAAVAAIILIVTRKKGDKNENNK